MNEKINLCEILKDCPINTGFYSPMIGNCKLSSVNSYDVVVSNSKGVLHINSDATATLYGYTTVELMLFPSQTQRDWSKWKCPKPKFDFNVLEAFDRILLYLDEEWVCEFFSHIDKNNKVHTIVNSIGVFPRSRVVPYNDETKHLVGTSDEAPDYYKYWED